MQSLRSNGSLDLTGGRAIKPSDILALRNNFKGCNPYKSPAYPEPSIQGALTPPQAQIQIPGDADDHNNMNNYHNINQINNHLNNKINNSQQPQQHLHHEQQQQLQLSTTNIATAPLNASASVDINSAGNITNSNSNTNSTNNQSSARRKNRRIGRHESRYTSGKFIFCFSVMCFSFLFTYIFVLFLSFCSLELS